MKRYKVKIVRGKVVLHVLLKINRRNVWRRQWGYTFATTSVARTFAEGNF